MAEQVVYNIRIEGADQAAEALGRTEAQLKAVNKARGELITKQSKGEQLSKAEQVYLTNLTRKQAELKAEKQRYNQIVSTEQKLTSQSVGAYQKLSASLNAARMRYRDLAAAGQQNTEQGKKLLTQIQQQDKQLKGIDASMGNYQRNVGDYKNQIVAAFGQMGLPVSKFNTLLSVQAGLQQKLTAATAGTSKAMRVLKVALISTGIGAIAVALGTLAAGFLSTQRGVDALNKVLIPLRTVLQRVWGVVQELSTGLVDAFSNPKQAIIDLWEALKTNVLNRFKGIADQFRALGKIIDAAFRLDFEGMKEGAAELGESTIQVLTGVDDLAGKVAAGFNNLKGEISTAADEGARLAEIKKQLELLAIEQARNEGRLNRIFEEQRTILMDVNATDNERLKAGTDAIKAAEEQKALKLQELELLIEQAAIKNKQNDTDREAQKEYAQLVAQREQLEADFLKETMRVRNQMNTINNAQAAEVLKELEKVNEFQENITYDTLDKLEAKAQAFKEAIQQAEESYNSFVAGGTPEEEPVNEPEIDALMQQYAMLEEYRQRLASKTLRVKLEYLKQEVEAGRIASDEANKLQRVYVADEINKWAAVGDAMSGFFDENSTVYKALSIASTIASTYSAATAALAPPPVGLGPVAGIPLAIATTAAGLANVAKISGLKFADGGIIGGQPHSSGGTKFVGSDGSMFEAERGEFLAIVNKHDAETAAAYSDINSRHGRKFAMGGTVVPQNVSAPSGVDMSQLEAMIRNIVAIPVVVAEGDITRAQRSVMVAETKGDY